ncbi:hypothetical protein Bhyg_08776, partial [Pseudolycoriella hygida]
MTLLVSWIRKRDLHILTAGVTVYTSDQRFMNSFVHYWQKCNDDIDAIIEIASLHIATMDESIVVTQVNRPKNSSIWTLQIKYPQIRDGGVYECQINTEPKMSLSYTLHII